MASSRTSRRRALAALGSLGALSLLAACDRVVGSGDAKTVASFRGLDLTGVSYGRDFRLPDVNGQERALADWRGKLVLLYFGFVQCPDVCPTALTRAVETRRLLGARGDQLQVIFVTVDPERDTPELLREYMAAFDPSFVALRGDAERLKQTAAEFKVYYQKVPTGSTYTMDHTALSYVFDAQGRLRLALKHEQTAQDYAHDIGLLIAEAA